MEERQEAGARERRRGCGGWRRCERACAAPIRQGRSSRRRSERAHTKIADVRKKDGRRREEEWRAGRRKDVAEEETEEESIAPHTSWCWHRALLRSSDSSCSLFAAPLPPRSLQTQGYSSATCTAPRTVMTCPSASDKHKLHVEKRRSF